MPDSTADYSSEPIGAADRTTLSDALSSLAGAFEALVLHARESLWANDCRAALWMRAHDELPLPHDVGEVRLLIGHLFTRCFAAADHVHAASLILQSSGTHASLATVTRGCIEALAKASYILTAQSATNAVQNNLRLVRAETRYLGKYSEIDVDGEPVEAEVVRNTIDQVSKRFAVTNSASVTELAATLLDRGVQDATGRHYYSHISSFAHAEVDSINIFLTPGNLRRPELPAVYASEWAGMCIGTSTLIGRDLVEFFGLNGPVVDLWADAVASANAALHSVR